MRDLCRRLGIPCPVREKDCEIEEIAFLVDGELLHFKKSKQTRSARLFFQDQTLGRPPKNVSKHYYSKQVVDEAKRFFAEKWNPKDDAFQAALQQSELIQLQWKPIK